jgi:adenylate cyclase
MSKKDEIQLPAEIERKFLVKGLPPSGLPAESALIVQGYIMVGPDGSEVRLRQQGDRFLQTIKRGKGLSREEVEVELTREQFLELWPLTKGRRLEKERFVIPYRRYVIELDVFHGELESLVIAEVEFDSLEESENFTCPDWFGEEVTGDPRYLNQNLALRKHSDG